MDVVALGRAVRLSARQLADRLVALELIVVNPYFSIARCSATVGQGRGCARRSSEGFPHPVKKETVQNLGVNRWTVPSLRVGSRDDLQPHRADRGHRDHSVPGAEVPSGPCSPPDSGRSHATRMSRSSVPAELCVPLLRGRHRQARTRRPRRPTRRRRVARHGPPRRPGICITVIENKLIPNPAHGCRPYFS
jgi:hypothetical protein